MVDFNLTSKERKELYLLVIGELERYYRNTDAYAVAPSLDTGKIAKLVRSNRFEGEVNKAEALNHVIDALKKYTVHTPHPGYFGLFNPRPNFPGILADLITAVFNPQLAAWSHAPFAAEVENYLIQEFGMKFGYDAQNTDGVFTTGGAEANLTALLCALNEKYPRFANYGLIGIEQRPIIYCSQEAHHSIIKAARAVGLGYQSVVNIPTDEKQALFPGVLIKQIQKDYKSGKQPLMVVATAGTTGSGGIDDLDCIAQIASQHQLWFHVDGAYGGAAILSRKLKQALLGIEKSDSITLDAHKWLSAPMGASMFLTSHKGILNKTFRVSAEYMPKEAEGLPIVDPFTHSIQWSRRFMGLKLYLSLLFFGWKGYEEVINHQTQLGIFLKKRLVESNWLIKNDTPLPIICFTDEDLQSDPSFAPFIRDKIIENGRSWISVYPIGKLKALRVCITNYSSSKNDIEILIAQLDRERKKYKEITCH